MSHNHMTMDHSGMDHSGMDHSGMDHSGMDHSGMDHSGMDHSGMDHSGMDHSGMDHSKMGHHGMAMDMMMQMYFTTSTEVTILFEGWQTTGVGDLVGSCIGIFVFAILYEGLKYFRYRSFPVSQNIEIE